MADKLNFKTTNVINEDNKNNVKTVLFLHGWGGSINSFLFVQKKLSDKVNTINLDFFGFGSSDQPSHIYDTYLYALSVYELLVSNNIKTVSIVAHSFGGRVAILLCSLFDIKVEKLVLVSSAGLKPKRGMGYYTKVYVYKSIKWLVKKGWLNKKMLEHFGSLDYKQLSPIMKQTFIKIVNQNLKCYLKFIEAKTLIVWGQNDKTTPLYMAKVLHKNIKQNELLVYKNCGHFCYLENINNFCDKVLEFVLNHEITT